MLMKLVKVPVLHHEQEVCLKSFQKLRLTVVQPRSARRRQQDREVGLGCQRDVSIGTGTSAGHQHVF